jgi:hypothetical protein
MDATAARAFVREHGVVLVAAKGPVPKLTEAIAGEPIVGSWWGHPKGHEIFAVLEVVTSDEDVLVCRAVNGKVTLVHRRLWPALIAAAALLPTERLARVDQEHTSSGRHVNHETPFPKWASAEDLAAAAAVDEQEAVRQLGTWVATPPPAGRPVRGKPRT